MKLRKQPQPIKLQWWPHHNALTPTTGRSGERIKGQHRKSFGSHKSARENTRRSLNYSHATSRTEDSARIISELRREIHDLKQDARSRSPAKERPRNRSEPKSSTLQPIPRQPLESRGHSRTRPPLNVGKGQQTKEHASKKTARPEGQHAVWRALDLIEMAEAFVARFISNSWKTKEMDALLTMKLQSNETIKEYSTRFWETYNDIDRCDEEVAVRTFKLGLPPDTGLHQSLTKHPAPTVAKLMHRIDQFIRVEEDGGGTTSVQTDTQPKVITPKPSA
uniref:Retrotransposon gag domain-containing protein n=1 Tax=Fagus sylvatica TaxID=28930 RepID=A0A2N9EFQ0_FAGSY